MSRPRPPRTAQAWRRVIALALALLASAAQATVDDDDDDPPAGAPLVLSAAQVAAVGIETAHPVAAQPKTGIDGYGRVVDTSTLVGDLSTLDAAQALARTSTQEIERLRGLHAGGAAASLKVVQAAQGEHARVSAEAQAAQARFNASWAPLAAMKPAERDTLVQRLRADRSVLLRADLPGQATVDGSYSGARVHIDGGTHEARVLGALGDGQSVNAAVLLELRDPPAGLARGARLAVTLDGEARQGFIVPRGALLHDENGAHVYLRLAAIADGATPFLRRDVQRLMRTGSGWLVSGVDADDAVVVRGLGLLWSMQGGAPIDDDD